VKLLRLAALAATALTCVMAVGAYRRSVADGVSFGDALSALVGEWSGPALRERARVAALNGLRAAEMRSEAADRELTDAARTR
jgi:hypothetical protein